MFFKGFVKTAGVGDAIKGFAKKHYYPLEQGGLAALTGLDLHEAYKAHKEGDKKARNKALAGAGALGTLMLATHGAH